MILRIYRKISLKFKLKKKIKISGRNNSGKITIFHRGGSHKKKYRIISNYNFNLFNGIIYNIEYDPNRNAKIAAVYNNQIKCFFYIIAPKNLKIGDFIKSGINSQEKVGHSMFLKKIPIGCPIFNITFLNVFLGQISKAAGTCSIILNKFKSKISIMLSSGKIKNFSENSIATLGFVSNQNIYFKKLKKAGRYRWLGFKPIVKGIAMNPIDHPNGGGEGKKSSKRKSPWGKIIKSKK
jgi:large subunit ribosomal protein L2